MATPLLTSPYASFTNKSCFLLSDVACTASSFNFASSSSVSVNGSFSTVLYISSINAGSKSYPLLSPLVIFEKSSSVILDFCACGL